MPGVRNREIILEVASFSVLILSSLEQACPFTTMDYSTTYSSGSECLPNLKNMAVYEGEENTIMSLIADPINKRWTTKPTSDELGTYTISNYDGYREPTLTGLLYLNQSGLVIRNATCRPTDYGNPISTSEMYIAECPNNIRTGVKLLVVPHCGTTISGRISTIQTDNGTGQISQTQPYTTTGQTSTTLPLQTTGPVSTTQPCTTIGETSASQRLTTSESISTTTFSNTTVWILTSGTATPWTRGWNSSGSPAWQPISTAPIARSSNIYANNSITTDDTKLVWQHASSVGHPVFNAWTTRSVYYRPNISTTTKSSISTLEEWKKNFYISPETKVFQHIKFYSLRLEFCSSPIIESSDELLEFDPSTDELIDIKGMNLSQGCLLTDYLVRIGNQNCTNCNLQDNQLSCRPPKVEPSPAMNDTMYCGQHLLISVSVGHNQYQYACLSYIYRSRRLILIVGLTVGLAGFAILLIILIICVVRRRRKKINLSKTCVHQNNRGQEVKNRVPKKAVQPKSQGDYGDMEHCYA